MGTLEAEARAAYLDKIRAIIGADPRKPWAVQGVFGGIGHSGDLPFAYTIGLTALELPELWIGTMPMPQGARILNDLAVLARERGGLPIGELIDAEWSTKFRTHGPVDLEAARVAIATEVYPWPQIVTVVQILWCDEAGRFPGEPDYDQARFPQRLLPMRGEQS